jgi:hypothetical protein
MKGLWTLPFALFLMGADSRDHLRGLLYRVDAQALSLRLHPDQAMGEGSALQREGAEAADALTRAGMLGGAAALRRESAAVADAVRRREPEDVRAHAIAVQRLVRELDDALPGPDIAH